MEREGLRDEERTVLTRKPLSRGAASSVHHHKTLNSHKGAPTFRKFPIRRRKWG